MMEGMRRLTDVLDEQRAECLHLIRLHRWVRRLALVLGPVYGVGLGMAVMNGNTGGLVLYLAMAVVMGWCLFDSTRKIERYQIEAWLCEAQLNTLRQRNERQGDVR